MEDNYEFLLSPADSLDCTNCSYPTTSPGEDTEFLLAVSDTYGCFTEEFLLNVLVVPPAFISMPHTFTPNGDGINDVIYAKGWLIEELMEFNIYNRWGELVFQSTDMEVGWDGTFNGRVQVSDVYVYQIIAIGEDGEEVREQGYIYLTK